MHIKDFFRAAHAAGVTHTRPVRIQMETKASLRNLRSTRGGGVPLENEERWKHYFPGGVKKVQTVRGLINPPYEALVNARRVAAGLPPDFTEAMMHHGVTGAHPEFSGEMAQHMGNGTEYLRFLPITDEHGNKVEDTAEFFHFKTGARIEGDELTRLQSFLRPEGSAAKQAGVFDADGSGNWTYAGEPGDAVRFRGPKLSNVKDIEDPASEAEGISSGGSFAESFTGPGGADPDAAPPGSGGIPPGRGGGGGGGGGGGAGGGPRDSDDAVERGNAARQYRDLGSAFGYAIGAAAGGGPLSGAIGATIGGMTGTLAGGGTLRPGDVARSVSTLAGSAVAGRVGAAIGSALGGLVPNGDSGNGGNSGGSGGGAGMSGGGGGGGGGGESEIIYWLREIAGYLRSINEGVIIRRGAGGSHV